MPWKLRPNYNDTGVDVTSDARVLFDAVKHGKTHLMRFILEASAVDIVNSRDLHGKTPLMACCYTKEEGTRDKTAKLLLRHGADVNMADDFGRTALSYVCEKRCNDILRILVKEHNVDPDIADETGQTPLMYSARIGNDIACDILIRHFRRLGLNVDARNQEGFTALLLATKHGNLTCAQILLGQGKASLEYRDNKFSLSVEDWLSKKGYTLADIKPVRVDGIGRSRFVKVANVAICATPKKVPLEEEEDATLGIDFNLKGLNLDQLEDEEGYSSDTTSRLDAAVSPFIKKYCGFDTPTKHYKVFPDLEKPPMINQETQTSDTDDTKSDSDNVHTKAVLRTNIDVTAPDPEPTDVSELYKRRSASKHIVNTHTVEAGDRKVKKASITCQTEHVLTIPCQNDKRFSLPNIGAYTNKSDGGETDRKHSMEILSDNLISKLDIASERQRSLKQHGCQKACGKSTSIEDAASMKPLNCP